MTKYIYRIAIVNKHDELIFLSSIFFVKKEAAIKEAEKLTGFKEKVKTKKYIDVCFWVANNYTWTTFEKIRSDSKGGHVGIITETLVLDDNDSLKK